MNCQTKLICIDCEFSADPEDYSAILEIGAAVGFSCDTVILRNYSFAMAKAGVIIDSIELTPKTPYSDKEGRPVYMVTPSAMNVNKIDLNEHQTKGESFVKVANKFNAFLRKNSQVVLDPTGKSGINSARIDKLTLVGHGVAGDIAAIEKWIPQVDLRKFINLLPGDIVDTYTVAKSLQLSGKLPTHTLSNEAFSLSLESLADYFCIPMATPHRAACDAVTNLKVFYALIDLMQETSTGLIEKGEFNA